MSGFLAWLETHLHASAWFRVGYVVVATTFTWQVMAWSERYAEMALAAKADSAGIAAVIGAVSAVAGAIQTFAFKHSMEA